MIQDYKYFIKNNGYCMGLKIGSCEKECIFKNGNNCKYDVKYRYKYSMTKLKYGGLLKIL
jgi:hypothetical protein